MGKQHSVTIVEGYMNDERLRKIALDIVDNLYNAILIQSESYRIKLRANLDKDNGNREWILAELLKCSRLTDAVMQLRLSSAHYDKVQHYLAERIVTGAITLPESP